MRNYILISILTLLLFACNSRTDNKSTKVEEGDNATVSLTNGKSERFFPENKATVNFDTLIDDKQLQVTSYEQNLTAMF